MAQVLRATLWPLRRTAHIHSFDFIHHTLSHCISTAVPATSELLSFVAPPSNRRSIHCRPGVLRRREPQVDVDLCYGGSPDADNGDAKGRGRNERKREARQAVRLGMDLASFSAPQIKRILRAASLEDDAEIFGALMLAKRLGPDVREGKRRQFNYIGKLLRDAKPDLLGALIQATKDGDQTMIQSLSGASMAEVDEEEEIYESENEEPEEEDQDSQYYVALANKWFDGLVNKDIEISNEVYSISGFEFDRQELRKLVRRVQSIEERQGNDEEGEEKTNAERRVAEKSLTRFLLGLAKQIPVE